VIIDIPATTTGAINKKLVDLRESGGMVSTSRVLTMVIVTDESVSEDAIRAANEASFEHPCRVIVIARGGRRGAPRLDGQIRVGGDAGASEVIVLRLFGELVDHGASVMLPLLLPDAPVVVWWPLAEPAVPAEDPIGALAQRRITDAAASKRPHAALLERERSYRPGDTDLAWTRLTLWRGLLASTLDQPPFETITAAVVEGASDSPSTDLLAGWLAMRLKCPVTRRKTKAGAGMQSVTLTRKSGDIRLSRDQASTATLSTPDQPDRQLSLPRRGLRDCIAEELRRLDADEVYHEVLVKGLPLVSDTDRGAGRRTPRKGDGSPALPAPLDTDGADPESTSKPKRPRAPKPDPAAAES
jgi:glucose-6-phosphate dehydrogenase assembly protein OpcA